MDTPTKQRGDEGMKNLVVDFGCSALTLNFINYCQYDFNSVKKCELNLCSDTVLTLAVG